MNNYIAVDIGASSGRLVRGIYREGILSLEELHRFSNGFTEQEGSCYWNIDYLFDQIIVGLQKAKSQGITACTLGIDTWGVDYVLLDPEGNRVQEVYAYRDRRTDRLMEEVAKHFSPITLYEKTGIQQLSINTLYQLYAHREVELAKADQILFVPDYLYYRLTGRKMNEVTVASTSQLLNLEHRDYDDDLLSFLNIKKAQFATLTEPGVVVGSLKQALTQQYDLPECQLICVAAHDTASAVLGAPLKESFAYISSGTWSLLGVERAEPLNSMKAMEANYTNEWGAYGTYRFLKNAMGLWLIQEVRRLLDDHYSFPELAELAQVEEGFRSLIPCNASRFLNPANMIEEIQSACAETGQPVPERPGQLARCIFDSLALSYLTYLNELEELTDSRVEGLQIVGGGANNHLLCQLTADVIGREVMAGPTEATALGNIVVQMISAGSITDLKEARAIIEDSFEIKTYVPRPVDQLDVILERWNNLHQSKEEHYI